MTCRKTQARFDERLDGRVDAASQQAFDAHVASCVTCGREWKAYAVLWQTLARHEGVEPSVGFAERTLRRLDEPAVVAHRAAWWLQPLLRWAFAASVAVLLGLSLLVYQRAQERQRIQAYQQSQADVLEDFDVIAYLDKLNLENSL